MQIEIEMELRKCQNCASKFRVMKQSSQVVCSTSCELFGLGAPIDRPNPLREEKPALESVTMSVTTPTKSLGPRKYVGMVPGIWKTPNSKSKKQKITMTPTGENEMQNAQNGVAETVNDSLRYSVNGITETKKGSSAESTSYDKKTTQPEASIVPSPNVAMVSSQSMNLLDDTATHLYALMQGLTGNRPPAEIIKYDPDVVNAACNCAKNIREIMKLKLDAIKVQLEFGK